MIAHDDARSGVALRHRHVCLFWGEAGWHPLKAAVSSQSGDACQRLAREIVSDGEAREQEQEEDGEKIDHCIGLPTVAFLAFRRACASVRLGTGTAQRTSVSLHQQLSRCGTSDRGTYAPAQIRAVLLKESLVEHAAVDPARPVLELLSAPFVIASLSDGTLFDPLRAGIAVPVPRCWVYGASCGAVAVLWTRLALAFGIEVELRFAARGAQRAVRLTRLAKPAIPDRDDDDECRKDVSTEGDVHTVHSGSLESCDSRDLGLSVVQQDAVGPREELVFGTHSGLHRGVSYSPNGSLAEAVHRHQKNGRQHVSASVFVDVQHRAIPLLESVGSAVAHEGTQCASKRSNEVSIESGFILRPTGATSSGMIQHLKSVETVSAVEMQIAVSRRL